MGTSTSGKQLAAKMLRAAGAIEVGSNAGVRAAALLITESVRRELGNAGVSNRLSGVGKSGAAIGVGFTMVGQAFGNPTALVKMRGPAQLVERDTKPHEIGVRTRSGKKGVRLPDGSVRRRIPRHPGTTGKHPFEKGVNNAKSQAGAAFQTGVQAALRKVF